ncbi:hypothetical protein AOQ84DRAFT_354423 [Glonium stellatum]|uniref:37S ribosomal protein Rsm22 n=1 Tax=Glonium stellatum TaxID=574774 RepID=A0A8E2F271_9PEZI|nr:hypothetical protein AOQ84DRAFT_354423 [Glonium stellatum]
MLTARGLPLVCLSCRLKILASARRSGGKFADQGLCAQRAGQFKCFRSLQAGRSAPHLRNFSSIKSDLVETAEIPSDGAETSNDASPIPSQPPTTEIEESVRRARRIFGDTLPREYLNDEEYAVYERLYGAPLMTDKTDGLEEQEHIEADLEEIEKPDESGMPTLLRQGENGELEEVLVLEDLGQRIDNEGVEEEVLESREALSKVDVETEIEDEVQDRHQAIYELSQPSQQEEVEDIEDSENAEDFMRAHPLTVAGRFSPSPSTVYLPKETFVDPISALLSRAPNKHISETAIRIFGGPRLPHSAATARASEGKEQKAIPLDPSQSEMGNIEGDVYMAAVMPGTYATVMSTIVEVRRRLGTDWIEGLMQKEGGPLILDAGAGGAAVVAWREVLQAEWQRMQEASGSEPAEPAPLGKAAVLTGSDVLRHRASRLLDNTSFLPRLPDTISSAEQTNQQQPRKFYDIIIAPHTLWPLRQEYMRKEQVEKLWSLLNPSGGVLILLEKGLPRGFEIIAAARSHLLERYISSPGSSEFETPLESQSPNSAEDTRFTQKETGMIVAPCTNHSACPMYQTPGVSKGRKDFCYFSQRYIRPPYLQRILQANDRNHEDVQFSYVAVQRGRDQRKPEHDIFGDGIVQGDRATDAAFKGHEFVDDVTRTKGGKVVVEAEQVESPPIKTEVNTLTLPRIILPALKRRGHIIMDVCTPAGKLERWTVPRSFSKQAFRDARKAQWGDLWALGAKTRIPRNVRLGRPRDEEGKKPDKGKKKRKQLKEIGVDSEGNVMEDDMRVKTGGRYSQDRKDKKTGRKGRRPKEVNLFDD